MRAVPVSVPVWMLGDWLTRLNRSTEPHSLRVEARSTQFMYPNELCGEQKTRLDGIPSESPSFNEMCPGHDQLLKIAA